MANVIGSTELKNRLSEILNRVYYSGNEMIVEHYGKPIVKLLPVKAEASKPTKLEIKRVLDETFGSIPDFPEVTKFRNFRRRSIKL